MSDDVNKETNSSDKKNGNTDTKSEETNSSDNKNGNTDIESIDEDISRLIFSISKDSRQELLGYLTGNLDQIWKMLNFLILLAGIYITVLTFVCKQYDNFPILWPTVLSGIFLIVALIQSIIGIFPTPSVPSIYPNEIYKLLYEKKDEPIKKLIETYLIHYKRTRINLEEKGLLRRKIILFIVISVTNFLLFGIYCVLHSYEVYVNIIAIIFSVQSTIFYFYYTHKEKQRIDKLKKDLDS